MRFLPALHISDFDATALPDGDKAKGWLEVATRPDGSAWQLPVLCVTGKSAGPTLLVLAGVHGNEYEGIEAIPRIFARTEPAELNGRLIMVSACNMPAYEVGVRNSPVDGHNLARVFPGDPDGTVSMRIAHWITEGFIKKADFLIDLHSGGPESDLPTLIGYEHGSDEAGRSCLAAARAFGAPVLWGHPPPVAPGRTCSAASENGVPWLYTETRGGGRATEDDLACYVEGVFNVMKYLDMLPGKPRPRPLTHHLCGNGNLDEIITAAAAGIFRAQVDLLQEVERGDTIGTVNDLFGQSLETVTADRRGFVILLRRTPTVSVGDSVACITGGPPD